MGESGPKARRNKPSKPYPDFPLFPHATGRWAKKVRGKLHYFGPWEDPQGALQRWLEQKDDLLAGRVPRPRVEGLTVAYLADRFLSAKRKMIHSGAMLPKTWREYHGVCQRLIAALGRDRLVTDLTAEDFDGLRAAMARTVGPVRLGNLVQYVRGVFKWAYESGLIEHPVRFGPAFKRPPLSVLRKLRAENEPRVFQREEIQTMLAAADQPLRTMILLGINGGFGDTDVVRLRVSAVDLASGRIDCPRPKTGVARQCALWPETVEALQQVMQTGPRNRSTVIADRKGHPMPPQTVCRLFRRFQEGLGIYRPGRGFYALRHTFRIVAEGCRDLAAIDLILGHTPRGTAAPYAGQIDQQRLRAVAEHVRRWLFEGDEAG
ncbi:MAG TPA: hypothetical protein EYP56_06195 [Planctomycetaceae bacterium]|nr:hypothetical protein [Planctomycetaceae bacterium]